MKPIGVSERALARELAAQRNIPIETARTHIRRAKSKGVGLDNVFNDHEDHPPCKVCGRNRKGSWQADEVWVCHSCRIVMGMLNNDAERAFAIFEYLDQQNRD